jgi:hypothetical protein
MTPDQLNTFKAAIVEAVEAYLATGKKITCMSFNDKDGKRCPIGCLAFDEMSSLNLYRYSEAVSVKMSFTVSDTETWQFIDGFDGIGNRSVGTELYEFGQEMRAKYLKEENA